MSDFIKYHFSYQELTVDPHQVAPLLGYEKRLPGDILVMVKEVMDETAGLFDICGGYQLFDPVDFVEDGYRIRIAGFEFILHKTVFHRLKQSERIAVFVCTAGDHIGQWSKRVMAGDPFRGFIADILGSVVIETAVDAIQHKLSNEMKQAGLHMTNRYSPGYCGWPTHEQHKLFGLLPEGICGIRLTTSALMLPIKSVSGFIGIGANVQFNPYTCQLCDAAQCVYRKFSTASFIAAI